MTTCPTIGPLRENFSLICLIIATMRVDHLFKSLLARELIAILDGTSGLDASEFLGVHPTRISQLRNGRLERISIAWLLRAIDHNNYDTKVALHPRPPATVIRAPSTPPLSVVRYDRFGQKALTISDGHV